MIRNEGQRVKENKRARYSRGESHLKESKKGEERVIRSKAGLSEWREGERV